MKNKRDTLRALRRRVKDLDNELLKRVFEFAAMREQRDALYHDLQERCPHRSIVHFQGRNIDDADEPLALDLRPAQRLCLDCGLRETGHIPDERTVVITQRIASSFTSNANVIDMHTDFHVLVETPIHSKCESEAHEYDDLSLAELQRWKRKIKASSKQ